MSDATADDFEGAAYRERLREGDAETLAAVFSHHRDRLWRTVQFRLDTRLAGRVDPDDVLQEAYLAAASRMSHYAKLDDMSPFLWLRLVVNQTLVDVHRRHLGAQRRSAAKERSINEPRSPDATSMSIAVHLLDGLTTPSGQVAKREQVDQLERTLETLSEVDREVLALRHFEELSNSETAAVLGISEKAASNRYARALVRLKDIMQQFPDFFGAD